ncbi:MAG: D-Ala-D-Ala carboxypeptidase family metallohydrolase [Elusimicrobia bacterium]|nr:D-Ala-D-Ala carboxypeptidase family metallohydrolase [Elusimicrobiota bacterium]
MTDFYLSENFTFFELTATSERELLDFNRAEGINFIIPLSVLCEEILEKVYKMYGVKPAVTSAFRCKILNDKLRGSADSQHLKGEAADFVLPGISCAEVFEKIKNSGLAYGQLILEKAGGKRWVHISLGVPYRPAEKCGQNLIL